MTKREYVIIYVRFLKEETGDLPYHFLLETLVAPE